MIQIESEGTIVTIEPGSTSSRVGVEKNGFDAAFLDVIAQYATVDETDTGVTLSYDLVEGEVSFREAIERTSTRLDRLLLAQSLVACMRYRGGFSVPLIHPDNVYVNGGLLRVVHCGLQDLLVPRRFDEALFLASLQAMVLQVFRPQLRFENLLVGAAALRDRFSTAVRQASTPEELFAFLDAQVRQEQEQVVATKVSVPKRRYAWFRILGVLGMVAAVAAGVFAWQIESENRLHTAVIAAQARFLANDYAGTLAALEGQSVTALPVSAKYVLAVSSVSLADLSANQKQSILNTISEKSDEVTLNYWVAMGRGEFEQALDYAKNLGDDQLTLLTYTDLYQATKLDSQMPGGEKQDLLAEYSKAIDDLTARLDGSEDTAGDQ